jgi:hypothetical protein
VPRSLDLIGRPAPLADAPPALLRRPGCARLPRAGSANPITMMVVGNDGSRWCRCSLHYVSLQVAHCRPQRAARHVCNWRKLTPAPWRIRWSTGQPPALDSVKWARGARREALGAPSPPGAVRGALIRALLARCRAVFAARCSGIGSNMIYLKTFEKSWSAPSNQKSLSARIEFCL